MAQFLTQEHPRKYARIFPLASEAVLEATYMDNTKISVVDEKVGIHLYKEISCYKSINTHFTGAYCNAYGAVAYQQCLYMT